MKILCLVFSLTALAQDVAPDAVALAGRSVVAAESPDARVSEPMRIAPGPPPLLSFRTYEGKLRQRFANSGLMLDDAGH